MSSLTNIANEIKLLEKGENLEKMHPSKKVFSKRFYKLDLKNQQIVANTRQCGKRQKTCSYMCILLYYCI